MSKREEQTTPGRIWLLLHKGEDGSYVSCDQPDPVGREEFASVEYVRADLVADLRLTIDALQSINRAKARGGSIYA
jgi:hypothetical protein